MSWRDPKLWLGVLGVLIVATLVLEESRRPSPGPLAPVHAEVPELGSAAGCARCHGGSGESMAEACGACHAGIAGEIAQAAGFHGQLDAGSRCASCHVEHHGDALALVDARVFALAGVPDLAAFDHGFVAFQLTGKHDTLACEECHPHANAAVLEHGERRFRGLDQDCTSCHSDPHEGRFVRGCGECHGQEHPFAELANFVHTVELPLTGGHAGLACVECHPKGGERSVERLGGAGPQPQPRRCQDCHESPHLAPFLARVATLTDASAEACCSECHAADALSFAGDAAAMPRELHAASGFALERPHDSAICADCHAPSAEGESSRARRFPGRRADDCAACHDDPHGGQFERGPRPAECVECHAADHFAPSTFDLAAHARSWPLSGAHARVECALCHLESGDEPRVFRGTRASCEACHLDVHGATFDAALAERADEARASGGTCGLCHVPERFAASEFGPREHASFTSFALRGAHARAECSSCHAQRPAPDANGRAFGRVEETFPGPANLCSSCHADVHQGAFDRAGLPRRVDGRASCARCHSEERFDELGARFDHGRWTSFALEGAHATQSCESCHGRASRPDASGRTLGFVAERVHGAPTECASCHLDVHDGAFDPKSEPERAAELQGCARCHTSESFALVARERFDHGSWTGFPLAGAHAAAACEACHVPRPQRDERGRSFGRAAGESCSACHVDPHLGQFARGGTTDCARCHDSAESFAELAFDHARDARFALDADHDALDCSACHKPAALPDGRRAVRYKPLGTRCVDCHGFEGRREGARSGDRK